MDKKPLILTAKINGGFPAKQHLYKPLAGKENEHVWPKLEKGYAFIKGEKYEVYCDKPSEEIFEIKRVSGSKKTGDSLE